MIIYNDPQGSEAWLARRIGVITGSRFKDARDTVVITRAKAAKLDKKTKEVLEPAVAEELGPSAKQVGYARDLARERVGGSVPKVFMNDAMRKGTEEEPKARFEYEARTGHMVSEAGFITTDDGRFGVSVDGLVGDDGIIEIKTMVSSATLFTAVVDGDISDYIDQCTGAMWLLGRKWCDLVLWAPDLAHLGRDLTVIRITRDDDVINALEVELIAFAKLVEHFTEKLAAPGLAA